MVIFADGANLDEMVELEPVVGGFTTNPSLMKKAGIKNYRDFAKEVLSITKKPVSFEILRDVERDAHEIQSWGMNAIVKVPIVDYEGRSLLPTIEKLSKEGIRVNVTAVFTLSQVLGAVLANPEIISVFAGRIADTGVDPEPLMKKSSQIFSGILWASAREVFNAYQAERCGCGITCSPDLIRKMKLGGKDLNEYCLETVRQFYDDAEGLCGSW